MIELVRESWPTIALRSKIYTPSLIARLPPLSSVRDAFLPQEQGLFDEEVTVRDETYGTFKGLERTFTLQYSTVGALRSSMANHPDFTELMGYIGMPADMSTPEELSLKEVKEIAARLYEKAREEWRGKPFRAQLIALSGAVRASNQPGEDTTKDIDIAASLGPVVRRAMAGSSNARLINMIKYTQSGALATYEYSTSVLATGESVDMLAEMIERKIINTLDEYGNKFSFGVLEFSLKTHPMTGARDRGSSHEDLPEIMKNSKLGLINPTNKDNKCFLYASLALGLPDECRYKYRPSVILKHSTYKIIEPPGPNIYPVTVENIDAWELANPTYCWNVFKLDPEPDEQGPIRRNKTTGEIIDEKAYHTPWDLRLAKAADQRKKTVLNVIIYKDHFLAMRNPSAVLCPGTNHSKSVCLCCMKGFFNNNGDSAYKAHVAKCNGHPEPGERKYKMPDKVYSRFEEYKTLCPHPVYVSADFEAVQVERENAEFENDVKLEQTCFAAGARIVSPHGESFYWEHLGPDAHKAFLRMLFERVTIPEPKFEELPPIETYCQEVQDAYAEATMCWCCNKKLGERPDDGVDLGSDSEDDDDDDDDYAESDRVRKDKLKWAKAFDHCHYTGKYMGAAHSYCNLKRKVPVKIPVLFHNMTGYDGHIIHQALADPEIRALAENKISSLHVNTMKFKSLEIGRFKFLDSCAFLQGRLETLLDDVPDADKHFLREFAAEGDGPGRRFELLRRKLPFPYESQWYARRDESVETLCREDFHATLEHGWIETIDEDTGKVTSSTRGPVGYKPDEYIARLKETCAELGVRTIGEMVKLYLRVDVEALADVLASFCSLAIGLAGIDPFHFVGLPSFANTTMMRITGARVRLISNMGWYRWFQMGIRGGVSMVRKRAAESNFPGSAEFDPGKPISRIQYMDFTSMYPSVMSQHLPIDCFDEVNIGEGDEAAAMRYVNDPMYGGFMTRGGQPSEEFMTERGAVLEVDLHFPLETHDRLNDFPPAPCRMMVADEQLSASQVPTDDKGRSTRTPGYKLMSQLGDITKYIVHISALKLYCSLGVRVTKLHRVMTYKQTPWMRPYIELMAAKRAEAKSEFARSFFKLMMNAPFGKTMEDVSKHTKTIYTTRRSMIKRRINAPGFLGMRQLDDDFAMAFFQPHETELNKPVFVGQAVLDLSKAMMTSFYYGGLKAAFPRSELLMTDTDSVMVQMHVDSIEEYQTAMRSLGSSWLDLSDLSPDDPLYDASHRKQLGYLTDETSGRLIQSFFGCRAKAYAYKLADDESAKFVCKGAPKRIAKAHFQMDHYKRVLFQGEKVRVVSHSLDSDRDHRIFLRQKARIALTRYDDKCVLLPDGIHALAHGHYRAQAVADASRAGSNAMEVDSE
ncbi:hypothetical protein KFE25_004587 [Diacronema lutheri]|uniref:DNA-directed DNA polymerase n=1 Tax=Diacronema lutheri TaxID=2081491 RepID=A0A8J6C0U3_DIALT|nr:hypothetical protein KFE25_004587 [Diacronema lutheri]